jgi:hypothetical protein
LDLGERSESFLVIAEALFSSIRGRIGSFEGIRGAGNGSGVVGINDCEAHTHNIEETSWSILIGFKARREINMTITQAVITFISTSSGFIRGCNLAEALLVVTGKRIRSEFNNRAGLPVFAFGGKGSPFSHIIKGFDLGTIIGTNGETEPKGTWAHATLLRTTSTFERKVVLIDDGSCQG